MKINDFLKDWLEKGINLGWSWRFWGNKKEKTVTFMGCGCGTNCGTAGKDLDEGVKVAFSARVVDPKAAPGSLPGPMS